MRRNLILMTDSYKASMGPYQYPPGTTAMYSYLESRGGRYGATMFFGLQYLLKEYLAGSVVTPDDVCEAKEFFAAHGEPFNFAGWMRIAVHHNGRLPIKIQAVPEGLVVPTHDLLMSVESTDPEVFWLVTWLETMLVRGLWYPSTVATQSFYIKRTISDFLKLTANDPKAELPFKLHDFGARGVSSAESAGIGGMAHLVNFQGSDTIEGVRFANHYYGCPMAGFSIPAAEHSTITAWGRDHELDAYRNMLRTFGKPGKLVAVVSDSYDIFNAVERFWGDELRDEVKASGATVVIRPDSGTPHEVVLRCLEILERKVGMTRNLQGYKVLPDYFRIIQGDGVNHDSIDQILRTITHAGYSASNVAFGMGGALLQQLNRDTQKFAFKCSEVTVDGVARPVFKDPITDSYKRSKRGRLELARDGRQFLTREASSAPSNLVQRTVFQDGKLLVDQSFDEVRQLAQKCCELERVGHVPWT